jgi:hypothetical protein
VTTPKPPAPATRFASTLPRFAPIFSALIFPAPIFLGLIFLALIPGFSSHMRLEAKEKEKSKVKPYALIIGTVWGPDDHPVYGVKVKIRRAKDKKAKWEMYSDHNGEFAQRVPAGECDYILTADLKGFKPIDGKPVHLLKEVTLHVYNDEREDTGLHLTQ